MIRRIIRISIASYPHAHGSLQLNIQDRKFYRLKKYVKKNTNI